MAFAKQMHRAIDARTTPTNPGRPRHVAALVIVAIGGAGVVGFAVSPPGRAFADAAFAFLAFYAGVFSLVALSLTVMCGLAATDRILMTPKHRILLQMVHRSLAASAMIFLVIHILTKIAQGHSSVLDVVVPFLADHATLYIGLGTIASYMMIVLTVTGIRRARFAGTKRPWLWRSIHVTAYACWPIALLHGLNAGRPAKPWVTISYILCLIFVGIGLLIRWWLTRGTHLSRQRSRTIAVGYPARPEPAPRPADAPAPASGFGVLSPGIAGPGMPGLRAAPPSRRRRPSPRPVPPQPDLPPWAEPSWAGRISTEPPAAAAMPPAWQPTPPPQTAEPRAAPPRVAPPRVAQPPVPERPAAPPAGKPVPARSRPRAPVTVGRWDNTSTDTITDEEFWAYLRRELLEGDDRGTGR